MADTKLTALTETTAPATSDDVYIVTTPGGTPASKRCTIANLRTAMSTPVEAAWSDYGGTSTVVGFSSFVTKVIMYKQIGKIMFVYYHLEGTSNATNFTFTVPTASSATAAAVEAVVRIQNSGTYASGLLVLPGNSSTVTIYSTVAAGAFGNTLAKASIAQFFYELA